MNSLLRGLLNLPPQASTYAARVDLLHFFVIGTTMLGATYVFVLALYFLVRYARVKPKETTAHTQTSMTAEAVLIGSLLSLFLIFWVVGATQYNNIMTPPEDAMPVYVTAKQWMWKFSYADGRSSMDDLIVPAHRPIKLVMTSRDVIHSFYVPAFRMKHDVVPGHYYTAWFEAKMTGVFPIECAEYCGTSHSRMIGRVRVLSADGYREWLEGHPPSRTEEGAPEESGDPGGDLVAMGREVASRRACFNCHTLDGQSHIGPSWAGLYDSDVKLADGRSLRADEAYLTRSMMDPQVDIVAGYAPVMPSYRGILKEPEVAALVEFIRSIRDRPFAPSIQLPKVTAQSIGQPQEPRP